MGIRRSEVTKVIAGERNEMVRMFQDTGISLACIKGDDCGRCDNPDCQCNCHIRYSFGVDEHGQIICRNCSTPIVDRGGDAWFHVTDPPIHCLSAGPIYELKESDG